jgi:cytochrome c-type biogenesis protein CcsB
VYPGVGQRQAEAHYYANFIGSSIFARASLGWLLYLVGALVAVVALVTNWRTPWVLALSLLGVALAWHAYGLGLRWYVLGRIPVANMFEAITAAAWLGIALALLAEIAYRTRVFLLAAHTTGFFALVVAAFVLPKIGSTGAEITSVMGILDDIMLRIHTVLIIMSYALIFLAAVIAVVYLLGYGIWRLSSADERATLSQMALLGAGPAGLTAAVAAERPILAGGAPGDEGRGGGLPAWLHHADWSHLIILNMAFVLLFVGIILGAVWADYSWGRPWGWDPKETFAINTWIIYAILVHIRFIVRRKGLWTAWLSVAGCAMMAFNWFVVNFYIVGLHSYA